MEEMDKPSDGRFWTVGGEWAKKYVLMLNLCWRCDVYYNVV